MKRFQTLQLLFNKRQEGGEWELVARGAVASVILQAVGLGLGFAVHIFFARWMGTREYGIYTYVLAWVSLLAIPAALGFPLLVVRFIPEYSNGAQWNLLRGLVQWGGTRILLVGFGLALTGMALVILFDMDRTSVYTGPLLLGLWLVPFQALLQFVAGGYQGLHRVGRAYLIPVFRHVLVLSIVFVMWTGGFIPSSLHALGATLVAVLVVLGIQGWDLWWKIPAAARKAMASQVPRVWLRISMPLLLVGGFVVVLNQTDLVMVGSWLGPHEAGLYRAASRTAGLTALVPIAVAAAADPMLARLYAEGDPARLQQLASSAVAWAVGGAVAVAVFFGLAGGWILGLFGDAFVAGYGVLIILVGGQVGHAGVGLAASLLNLTGHEQWGMRIFGGGALLNVVLNAVGILLWGSLGTAVATAVSLVAMSAALWLLAKKKTGIDASVFYAVRFR